MHYIRNSQIKPAPKIKTCGKKLSSILFSFHANPTIVQVQAPTR